MNFLTGSVIFSLVSCLIFTVVVIILSAFGVMIPDTLIQYFFITFGTELGCAALIKIANHLIKKQEVKDKINLLKQNDLPIEKKDITNDEDSEEFEDGIYYG